MSANNPLALVTRVPPIVISVSDDNLWEPKKKSAHKRNLVLFGLNFKHDGGELWLYFLAKENCRG